MICRRCWIRTLLIGLLVCWLGLRIRSRSVLVVFLGGVWCLLLRLLGLMGLVVVCGGSRRGLCWLLVVRVRWAGMWLVGWLVLGWGIRALIAPRGSPHGSGLGRTRWVVERTHAWFGHFRRLAQCYERQEGHFLGMQQLAACVICARRVRHGRQPAEEFQPFAHAA